MRIRTLIMGAAGRDFHNFNVVYRDNDRHDVVAFTATQIPDIAGRRYPAALAGPLYPDGIPIHDEPTWPSLIDTLRVDEVVFSYSDVSYAHVMHRASLANASGARFVLLGARETMLTSTKPVVAVCAVRTGAGKSQTTRRVAGHPARGGPQGGRRAAPDALRRPRRAARPALRHPRRPRPQHCTIEEIEEYEPHIVNGTVVYAGVDYEAILRQAEAEADVVLWDGGNNDLPFYRPGPAHRRGRPAPAGARAGLLPGRDQRADGARRDHQQGGQRHARGRRHRPRPTCVR